MALSYKQPVLPGHMLLAMVMWYDALILTMDLASLLKDLQKQFRSETFKVRALPSNLSNNTRGTLPYLTPAKWEPRSRAFCNSPYD